MLLLSFNEEERTCLVVARIKKHQSIYLQCRCAANPRGPEAARDRGPAHLYSRVCRSSFWETGVFLAWGIAVSTAIFEMHSKWAGIRDWIRRVSHATFGSWARVGNPWVAEWQIGQIGKSWRPRAFIFLHPLVPWLLCRCWRGPRADDPLCSSPPADEMIWGPGSREGRWWTMGSGAYWQSGLSVMCTPRSRRKNFPWLWNLLEQLRR